MPDHIDRADVRVTPQDIAAQLFDSFDLLRMVRRELEYAAFVGGQIDDLDANRGVVEAIAVAPGADPACQARSLSSTRLKMRKVLKPAS